MNAYSKDLRLRVLAAVDRGTPHIALERAGAPTLGPRPWRMELT
jgi:hypothetical protein